MNTDPNARVRETGREFTRVAISHYRSREAGRHVDAGDYARLCHELAAKMTELVGRDFAEALLTYCRAEALLLVEFPYYAETHGHWVLGTHGGWGGFDSSKIKGAA